MAELDIAELESVLSDGDRRRIPGNNFAPPDKIEWIIRQLIAANKAKDAEIAVLGAHIDELNAERRRDALDGQGALDEANNRIVELEAQLANAKILPPMNDDLIKILGRQGFLCSGIAENLRSMGMNVPHKTEAEQAYTIHYLLGHYLKDSEMWAENASIEFRVTINKIKSERKSDGIQCVKCRIVPYEKGEK